MVPPIDGWSVRKAAVEDSVPPPPSGYKLTLLGKPINQLDYLWFGIL